MKVLIVDDEPLARARLIRLLNDSGEYQPVGEAANGHEAVVACRELHPDIVLMDIRMPGMDGLEAALLLAAEDEPPAVIFCTAYDDYAIKAFDANAVGYLLKPVDQQKLSDALRKAQKLNRMQLSTLATNESDQRTHIHVRGARGDLSIAIDDVRYFLADHKYVTVFYRHDQRLAEALIDDSLKDMEESFGERLLRVHRNALVVADHVQGIDKDRLGNRVRLADVSAGPQISRRHLTDLRQWLQRR